jgi:predicted adenine nucleotide alpha hydrolase (AANH) superfamily ATPase/VanZ family protein
MSNKIIKTSLPIFWMGLIFVLSHQPYNFFPFETTIVQQIVVHIFLYAVLAYFLVIAIFSWNKSWQLKNILSFSVFFSIFYGITDEYHQGFIPGRFVSFLDLGFDTIGAVLGAFLYYLKSPFLTRKALLAKASGLLSKGLREKPKLLLHICCVGCGIYISNILKKDYNIVLYFYNPNIFPEDEYSKRLNEAKNIAKRFDLRLIVGAYDHGRWLESVKGYESEPERGERCLICYGDRIKAAVNLAREKEFDYFTTTLTVSPHKDARAICEIGKEFADKYGVQFLDKDFKKQNGFKKACELSKKLGLYRQNYCGCEFSSNLQIHYEFITNSF